MRKQKLVAVTLACLKRSSYNLLLRQWSHALDINNNTLVTKWFELVCYRLFLMRLIETKNGWHIFCLNAYIFVGHKLFADSYMCCIRNGLNLWHNFVFVNLNKVSLKEQSLYNSCTILKQSPVTFWFNRQKYKSILLLITFKSLLKDLKLFLQQSSTSLKVT